jgi:hypothetical protein
VTRRLLPLNLLALIALCGAIAASLRADEEPGRASFRTFGDPPVTQTAGVQEPSADTAPIRRASFDRPPLESPAADLPPLQTELHRHGGSYLYEPLDISERLYRPPGVHWPLLRLPADWQEPQPLSLPEEFLGSHPILWDRVWSWFGAHGYQWEPRLVVFGSYEVFAAALEDAGRRRDGIGHQLLLDIDLALTGTERAHVQFRPLGGKNSGGSFYSFSAPEGYVDNSEIAPQRWWIEGELQSIFGGLIDDPTQQWDINFTLGKFPLVLQNYLLMNDEVTGILIGKNTLIVPPFSNINVQTFYLFDDVDAFSNRSTDIVGVELTADYRLAFLEATYIHTFDRSASDRDADFFALSGTQFFGPLTLAGRAMFKTGDRGRSGGSGDGQLYVLESSLTRKTPEAVEEHTGVELAVGYLNLFHATEGWSPVAGGNFDRLRSLFVLDPLLQIAMGRTPGDTLGAAAGVQLFRHHQDESIIPEVAIEEVRSETVWGIGLQYERKLSPWIYLNLRGVKTWSGDPTLVREGILASTFFLF